MAQDLAALLVEEGAVSKVDVDRAVARQEQAGGALDTALLELGLIGEGHLLSFLSHAADLPPVPASAFGELDPRVRRVFPAKVAERHRLAPFALDGRELSVVAVHPVDAAAIDEIGFMLSLTLLPHVGPEWRVQALIQRLYGGQLPARLARLADASAGPPPEAPRVAPPPLQPAASAAAPSKEAPSVEEAFFAAGEAGTFTPTPVARDERPPHPTLSSDVGEGKGPAEDALPPDGQAGRAPVDASDETSFGEPEPERAPPGGFGRDGSEPAEPLLAALELAFDAFDSLSIDVESPASEPPSEGAAPAAGAEGGDADARAEAEAAAVEDAREDDAEPEEPPVLDRSAPPRWSVEDARTALAAARHRDEVVLTALRYARDFFEFSALFAVTRDAVVGHDALGIQEDARSHCRATAIYAADPGVVKTVLETHAPYLGHAEREATGTANILNGLWRGTPRTVLLYPILLGDRPVAVLYADNGEAPVSPRRLGDLLLFLSTVGGNFERIIRARKKRRPSAAPKPPPPEPTPEDPPSPEPAPDWMAPPPDAIEPPPAPTFPGEGVAAGEERPPPAAGQGDGGGEPPSEEPAPPPPPADAVESAMAALLTEPGDGSTDPAMAIVDLILHSSPDVAAASREALVSHRRDAAVRPLPERLRRALLSGVGDRPLLAARALGALRDVESIPILIQALEIGSPETAGAAADALAQITMQRHGPSAQSWLRWWKENRGRSRAEWLFAALTSADRDLRLAASGELRSAAEPPVRYSADMPAAELAAAARAWWVWWSRQGIVL